MCQNSSQCWVVDCFFPFYFFLAFSNFLQLTFCYFDRGGKLRKRGNNGLYLNSVTEVPMKPVRVTSPSHQDILE